MSQWTGQSAQGTGLRKRDSSGIGDLLVLHDEMFHGDPKDERVPAQGGGERRPEVTVNVNSRPMAQPAEHSAQASERQGALFGASSDGTSILRKVEQEEDFSSRLRKRLEDACESSPDRSITSMSHEFGAQNSQIIQGWRPPSSARDQKGLGLSPPKPEPPVRPEPSESPPLREPAVSAAAAIPAVVVAQEPPGGNVLSGSGEPHASAGEKMERATAGMSGASGISLQASDLQLTAAGESVEPSKVGLEQLPLEHEPERSRFQPQAPEALEAPKAPKASEAPVRLESGESLDDTVAPEGNTVSVSLLRPQSPAESLPVDAEVDHHAPETTPSPSSILNSPSPSGKNPGKKKNRLMLQLPGAMPQPMVRDSVRQVQLTVSAAFGESDAKGTDLGPAVLDGNRKKQKAQMRSLHLQGVDEEQCADELATDVLEDGPGTSAEEPPLKSILKKSQDGKGGAKLSLRTTTMMAGLAARGRRGSSQVVPMEEMELPPSKTVRIVDNTDEMKAKRRSQREFEWKERQQKIHSQRRMKALGSMLRTPIGLAIYLGKCYLASPKARQVWLVAILSVCLFELWSAALFIAFVLDPSKANFLSTLLSYLPTISSC